MSLNRANISNAGFTLMELLISISVIMMIMAVAAGAFRLGFKAVEKGETAIDDQQRLIIAVNYISDQLQAVCLDKKALFQGSKDSLVFQSKVVSSYEDQSLRQVEFGLAKKEGDKEGCGDVQVSTKKAFPLTEDEKEADKETLLSGVESFSIAYLQSPDLEKGWLDTWENEIYFPLAVKVEFIFEAQPVTILVRILRRSKKLENA